MTSRQARVQGQKALEAVTDTANLDSRLLMGHVLKLSQTAVILDSSELTLDQEQDFFSLIKRRIEGEPVAYLLGYKEFFGRNFIVTHDTLIPRPDTECLIEKVLSLSSFFKDHSSLLDICTGTGCIGITLKAELEKLGHKVDLTLSDISAPALEVAKLNSRQIIENKANFILSNLFEAIKGESFDIITANPPYIAKKFEQTLSAEVLREPHLALFAENEGLELLYQIVKEAKNLLNEKGLLIMECDSSQIEPLKKLMEEEGYEECFVVEDLGNRPRCIGGFACMNS